MLVKEQRTLTANGETLTYTLTRKSIKNINLRVQKDGSVTLSAPMRVPLSRIESFILSQTDFIARARRFWQEKEAHLPPPLTLKTGDTVPIHGKTHTVIIQNGTRRGFFLEDGRLILTVHDTGDSAARLAAFQAFLDDEAKRSITASLTRLLPLFYPTPRQVPTLVFRTMTSKWGVCRPQQCRITFNRNLVYLPEALADYVICHELAHFRHADHSKAFWQHLGTVMPDYSARKKALCAFPLPRFAT